MRPRGQMQAGRASVFARALGWFGVGLGMVECLAPRQVARGMGIRAQPNVVRLLGVREIASGLSILTQRQPAAGLWARVGGDALDIAFLLTARKTNSSRANTVLVAVAGVAVVDALCGMQATNAYQAELLTVQESIAINRSPEEVYRVWRDFAQLPQFMAHLESVEVITEIRSHWVAKGPVKGTVAWDAEIIVDEPNQEIAWQTLSSAQVGHTGRVRFERLAGGLGTIAHVALRYQPPAGVLGGAFAKLMGRAPEQQIQKDLLNFKRLLETGEIPTTEGQPAGRASSLSARYDLPVRR